MRKIVFFLNAEERGVSAEARRVFPKQEHMNMVKTVIESRNKNYRGFRFEQHKYLGQYIKHRREEALNLSVVSSWCYGKTTKIYKLAFKLETTLLELKFQLDNAVCGETLPNHILFKDGYDPELDPVKCYYGGSEFREQWNREFINGFRPEFQKQSSQGLYPPSNLPRRRDGFTLDEHRHVARILRCQIRQASIITIIIWNVYGTKAKVTRSAYHWWKTATTLFWELNQVSGDIPDLYCISDSFNGLEAEIVADQSFAEPLIVPLPKSRLEKSLISSGEVVEDKYNLDIKSDKLYNNITYP